MIGFLNINKPTGKTSSNIVVAVRKILGRQKIGHMGTLDPMASGVLPIAVGKATRLFDYFQDKKKEYIAVFEFGYETDTLDITGEIQRQTDIIPTEKQIREVLPLFCGKISQIPPQYSAKSVDGVRVYKLARQGIEVQLQPKEVEIYSFDLLEKLSKNTFRFRIVCSSGTYIRSLCRDIAHQLSSLASMSFLERTSTGIFTIEQAVQLQDLSVDNILDKLLPVTEVFKGFPKIDIDERQLHDLSSGKSIEVQQEDCENIFVIFNTEIVGVGRIENNLLQLKTYLYG